MNVQKVSLMNNIKFKAGEKPETAQEEKPKPFLDNKKKIVFALGALAAAGIAAVAISRGRKVPPELSFDKFKKIGKFEKGKAIVKGQPYTGIIKTSNKNGDFNIKYTDGVLQSSLQIATKGEGDNALLSAFEKQYSYDENGKLSEVVRYRYHTSDAKAAFSPEDIINNRDQLQKHLVRVEDGYLKISDNKISIRSVTPEQDKILIRDTYFNENGSVDSITTGYKLIGKDTICDAIQKTLKNKPLGKDALCDVKK